MEFDSFVLAASVADLDEAAAAARGAADAVEFRLDLTDDPLAALDDYDGDAPLIATNRARWEGGEADPEGRLALLADAAVHPDVEAVDVELASLRGSVDLDEESGVDGRVVRERARERGAAVIASIHDFDGTPDRGSLDDLLEAAAEAGDVGKVAVTATDRGDALSLLSATHAASEAGARVATMAMGEAGRHTRAVAPLYGSRIGYAPVDPDAATAPGQYDLATLAELIDRLD